jgi:hypothetical protein
MLFRNALDLGFLSQNLVPSPPLTLRSLASEPDHGHPRGSHNRSHNPADTPHLPNDETHCAERKLQPSSMRANDVRFR